MSSQHQSRDRDLYTLQELTGFNIEDCILLLRQYEWKLQAIVDDFQEGKEFKMKFTPDAKEKSGTHPKASAALTAESLGNNYTKNDQKCQPVNADDDRYYAHLLEKYGEHDAAARRHCREERQPQYQPPQENDNKQPIYHERQEFRRCGIHSLNNLFQIPHLFAHQHLDALVREFDTSPANSDYGHWFIGDYDLRVLIEAIKRCGYQVRQLNFYNGEALQTLPWDSYFGLLININGSHWFTIKNLHGSYYNLDSTFAQPSRIGLKDDLVNYLIRLIYQCRNMYIFTVSQGTNSIYQP